MLFTIMLSVALHHLTDSCSQTCYCRKHLLWEMWYLPNLPLHVDLQAIPPFPNPELESEILLNIDVLNNHIFLYNNNNRN